MRDNRNDPTPYAILCSGWCGRVFLTEREYQQQMADPDKLWICPGCKRVATWDDDSQASSPPDEET